jgi:hypothetical protein
MDSKMLENKKDESTVRQTCLNKKPDESEMTVFISCANETLSFLTNANGW